MSLMGVDVGSTGAKAVVFSTSGSLVASAYEEYPSLFPSEGWVELDSVRVVDAVCRVIAESSAQVAHTDPVESIGIASHGEAFTPVASDGRLMGNAMAFSDSRADAQVESWCENFGSERFYQVTGRPAYTMYSLFKLLWIKEHRSDMWRSAWKFLFFGDLIAFVLTGETKTDYTLASRSAMFDILRKTWSSEILDSVGLDVNRLSEPILSGSVVGTVKQKMADMLGIDSKVTVVIAGHDQPVGALGCGASVPGIAAYALGTAECLCPHIDSLLLSSGLMTGNMATDPHVFPDAYTILGFSLTGGNVLRWVRDNLAADEAREARDRGEDPYDRIIAAASDDPSRLILIPHMGPTGTPHFDPVGFGALIGLTFATGRPEILRAFIEGITYDMMWNLSILVEAGFSLSELRVIGGGSKNDILLQIKADMLGVPLTSMKVTEATCMGAAILAGHGTGVLNIREASQRWAAPAKQFIPRSDYHQAYQEQFAVYKEAYTALGATRRMMRSANHLSRDKRTELSV